MQCLFSYLCYFLKLLFIHAQPEHSVNEGEKSMFSKDIAPNRASGHFRGSLLKKDSLTSDDGKLKHDSVPASSQVENVRTPATETLTNGRNEQ